jgi:raffinose/stachyose/melibiose transport system substrate-binding protein
MKLRLSGLLLGGAMLCAGFAATAASAAEVKWFISENTPEQTTWMRQVAKTYEASHPGTTIAIQVMSGEAYKAKLTTSLQSPDRPDLFYTWGGGVMFAQADAGLLQDISAQAKGAWNDSLSPAAVDAMSYKGKQYGAPEHFAVVALWDNKALFAKAGVDPKSLATWDGLLDATKKFKAAGITPFGMGGSDKWPVSMIWDALALRIGGKQGFMDAMNRTGPGFDGADFLKASEDLKQLTDLDPFQKGFLGDTAPQAEGAFGDGKQAMQVMGNWFYNVQKTQSISQTGVPDSDLGWASFPQVAGGKGNPSDVVGGVNGYLVTKSAPPEAVDFLKYYTSADIQRQAAQRGFYITVAKGTDVDVKNPFYREMAEGLQKAQYVQNFYDQMLGPNTGRVVNDATTDLATARIKPADVGKQVQDAWDMDR